MPIALQQNAGNSAAGDNASCRVSLTSATRQGSLIVVIAAARARGTSNPFLNDPSGFTRVAARRSDNSGDDVAIAVWFRQNASPISSVTVQATHLSLSVRVLEFTGVAQANALDRITTAGGDSTTATSGVTGTIAQADSVLVGAIVNQYSSTRQSGFTGGLGVLADTTSPSSDLDGDRHRLTVHAATTSATASYALGARLSASRDWAGVLVSFRGGSLGPARMSSKRQPPGLVIGGRARLSAFGPMRSKQQPVGITIAGRAWMGPFEGQMLLGGRNGLLIGLNTPYRIESIEGLGGWDIRQSDTEFPRGDGAQRGVDLQSARTVMVTTNFDGREHNLEDLTQELLAALRPQRDTDWPLIFRLPGVPLQQIYCRPGSLTREITAEQLIRTRQSFVLRAADPRIYSTRTRQVVIPATPTETGPVTAVSAPNSGNSNAYPTIRIRAGADISRIELVNSTADVTFDVDAVLGAGVELVGDMPARITAAPRSVITVDGQAKYGSWVAPREPFFLAPDPIAPGGVNAIYLRTTPAGAPVTCVLEYPDTWGG